MSRDDWSLLIRYRSCYPRSSVGAVAILRETTHHMKVGIEATTLAEAVAALADVAGPLHCRAAVSLRRVELGAAVASDENATVQQQRGRMFLVAVQHRSGGAEGSARGVVQLSRRHRRGRGVEPAGDQDVAVLKQGRGRVQA